MGKDRIRSRWHHLRYQALETDVNSLQHSLKLAVADAENSRFTDFVVLETPRIS